MRICEFAHNLIAATTLAGKLQPPPHAYDDAQPNEFAAPSWPGRPANLAIVHGNHAKVPPITGMRDPHQRVRILHALANHELQAIELFAWALLRFPDAPPAFRRGLVAILADEQRHMQLYLDRLAAHGHTFGDFAVTGHFWHKLDDYRSPTHFVCVMGLTFENANLDFCCEYATAATAAGDHDTARVLQQVHDEEISHVHFGWVWLHKFAQLELQPQPAAPTAATAPPVVDTEATDDAPTRTAGPLDPAWQVYCDHLSFPLGPHRARGKTFDVHARKRAGLSQAFIDALAATAAKRPSGQPR